ncbi:Hypothetical_protein [Hexamita inflata]|uniref:Hypothetical_protein n=1 Tax=Hexamita inflata TaxID=28002 RepID=A0ABP1GHS6_9EUKA
MESKTEVTYIQTGIVEISRGKSSNCFNDNDSYVELYQGSVVAVLYPTFRCINVITTIQGQTTTLNTPFRAKVYITYTDNSLTIHDQLFITVEQSIFIPENKYTSQSIPVRIRLANSEISQYFEQKIINETITKDMKMFQVQLYFTTQNTITPVIKVTRTQMNFYLLAGIQNVFDKLKLMFLANGFVLQKQLGQYASIANQYLTNLGVDSYQIEYTFVTYDVNLTDQLRIRLIAKGLDNNLLFNNNSRLSNCQLRFPNQNCDELMEKLKQWDISQLTPYVTYHFYKGQQQVQLWEVELLFLVYYVSNYILKYFATSNADDKFQQIISSWRLFMNYSLTQEGQKYDFDRIRPQSTIQSRYLIFQKGKIEITTCNKRTAMTKINAVGDVQGRSTNSLNKLRQF